jgi:hypothetical protein
MRTSRRWVVGLVAAPLLLSVPASALHQAFAARANARQTSSRVTIRQQGSSATAVIFHQNEERRTYAAFARVLRAQFRGNRGNNFLRASVNRYLRDLLLDLRDHWRVERRAGVVSPFDFPDL